MHYTLELYIQPQANEHTPQETAHGVWNALGRPLVTISSANSCGSVPVFRFSALDLEDLRDVARWYTNDDAEEVEKILLDVTMHGDA